MRVWKSLLVCTLLTAACAPRPPRPAAVSAPAATDPDTVYATVRRREEAIRTLRAQFAAVVHQGESERHADGVLLVKKPDRFRMRLMSPFGLTVFDYTSWDDHARMVLPLEGKRLVDDELRAAPFAPADMRPAFLRAQAAFPGQCTPRAEGVDTLVECRDSAGALLRTIRILPAAQTISEEVSFAGGYPYLTIRYADYRQVGGTVLPFAITLSDAQRDVQLAIALRSYDVNPVLGDDLFAPAAEAGQ